MIRPEVAALLRRYAEPLLVAFGAGVVLWKVFGPGALRGAWFDMLAFAVVAVVAVLWLRASLSRARLSAEVRDGAGAVFVEERRVVYLGPFGRAEIDLDSLVRVEAASGADGGRMWMLVAAGRPPLAIPDAAEGAGALVDAFSALPQFDFDAAAARGGLRSVWRRRDGVF